jgi:capsular polysaccharide biosynthesis protein
MEKLPTLRAIPKLNENGIRHTIIINSNSPNFVKESIELIDPDVDKIESTNAVGMNMSNAIIPEERPFSGYDYSGTKQEIRFIRHHLSAGRSTKNENSKFIFSSRADSDSRNVKNRQELVNFLRQYEFIPLIGGKHSVRNQIALFKHADVVIGPSGANLVNIVFCQRAHVFEIVGADTRTRLFELLCEAIGHEHQYLHGKKAGEDFFISIPNVKSKLDTIINS